MGCLFSYSKVLFTDHAEYLRIGFQRNQSLLVSGLHPGVPATQTPTKLNLQVHFECKSFSQKVTEALLYYQFCRFGIQILYAMPRSRFPLGSSSKDNGPQLFQLIPYSPRLVGAFLRRGQHHTCRM